MERKRLSILMCFLTIVSVHANLFKQHHVLTDTPQDLMTILRDQSSSYSLFRKASDKLSYFLANKVANFMPSESITITTPCGLSGGKKLTGGVVIIPILRAAFSLLPAFLNRFEYARVGFVGLYRDEQTALPQFYYSKIPEIHENDQVIIIDPMLATAGSACYVISLLKKAGVNEDKILFAGVIGAPEALSRLEKDFPGVSVIIAALDDNLNDRFFIVPGLGDYGDRYFGTN